jgi:hypothetical protein
MACNHQGRVCCRTCGEDVVRTTVSRDDAARAQAIADVAKWMTSSMASGMFGSDTYGLRRRLAEVVREREWETTLKEQTLRP